MMIGPRLWWLLRDIPGSLRQYLRAIRGPLALSAITVVSLSASARLLENAPVGFILGGAILAAIGTGGIIYLVSRFIRREIMDTMKFVTGKWDPGSSKREGASS